MKKTGRKRIGLNVEVIRVLNDSLEQVTGGLAVVGGGGNNNTTTNCGTTVIPSCQRTCVGF